MLTDRGLLGRRHGPVNTGIHGPCTRVVFTGNVDPTGGREHGLYEHGCRKRQPCCTPVFTARVHGCSVHTARVHDPCTAATLIMSVWAWRLFQPDFEHWRRRLVFITFFSTAARYQDGTESGKTFCLQVLIKPSV